MCTLLELQIVGGSCALPLFTWNIHDHALKKRKLVVILNTRVHCVRCALVLRSYAQAPTPHTHTHTHISIPVVVTCNKSYFPLKQGLFSFELWIIFRWNQDLSWRCRVDRTAGNNSSVLQCLAVRCSIALWTAMWRQCAAHHALQCTSQAHFRIVIPHIHLWSFVTTVFYFWQVYTLCPANAPAPQALRALILMNWLCPTYASEWMATGLPLLRLVTESRHTHKGQRRKGKHDYWHSSADTDNYWY